MKANQTKTKAADQAKKSAPFFNKEAGQSYFQPVQTKLSVNQPGDPFEKEADQVADQVVQKMDKGTIGRKPIFESKNDDGVQRKAGSSIGSAGSSPGSASVPASVQQGLAGSKGAGIVPRKFSLHFTRSRKSEEAILIECYCCGCRS